MGWRGRDGGWAIGLGLALAACDKSDGSDAPAPQVASAGEPAAGSDTELEMEPEPDASSTGAGVPASGESSTDSSTGGSGAGSDTDASTGGSTDASGTDDGVVRPEPCEQQGVTRECNGGIQFCDDGVWGPCMHDVACEPGEITDCWTCEDPEFKPKPGRECDLKDECVLDGGVPTWSCDLKGRCECDTPLVLAFGGAEPSYESVPSATFDISVAGGCLTTDWPRSDTPWLALDRDGDGAVADGRELFGSGTRLEEGRARNGFAALAEIDTNGDRRIDARDAAFADLVLWFDDDRDKRGVGSELRSLGDLRVLSLELDHRVQRRCDDRGNCGVERARFTWTDAGGGLHHGEIIDVHLPCR
jgi:hypothetical protein